MQLGDFEDISFSMILHLIQSAGWLWRHLCQHDTALCLKLGVTLKTSLPAWYCTLFKARGDFEDISVSMRLHFVQSAGWLWRHLCQHGIALCSKRGVTLKTSLSAWYCTLFKARGDFEDISVNMILHFVQSAGLLDARI